MTDLIIGPHNSIRFLYDEVNRLAAEVKRLEGERDEARRELAGAEGELMGLRVSEAFFRNRSEVIELAALGGCLTKKQSESLQGCCPLCALGDHEVCADRARLDRLKADDLAAERDAAREAHAALIRNYGDVMHERNEAIVARDLAASTEREAIAVWLETMLARPVSSESETVIAAIRAGHHHPPTGSGDRE